MTRSLPVRVAQLAVFVLPLIACRDSSTNAAASTSLPIGPSSFGASGCAGPDQVFTVGQMVSSVTLATLSLGPNSQMVAARGADVLYATGTGATVVELDFTGGSPPVETELVTAGAIAALYAAPSIGIVDPPELSGIAVLDADTLVVMEHTANVLLLVDRAIPDTVTLFAGGPSTTGGFADGFAAQLGPDPVPLARFSFDRPAQLVPTSDMPVRIFINDPGNHALRLVTNGLVSTIAGNGAPFFSDGDLGQTSFDTPIGLAVTCNNALLVTEGNGAVGGNRVRRLTVGANSPFTGSLFGLSETVAGDGAPSSIDGIGESASVGAPFSPITTTDGDIYWVDSETGVLRRLAGDLVDCPLAMDCAAASATPTFTPGSPTTLTQTETGVLYALDPAAATLYRVTP